MCVILHFRAISGSLHPRKFSNYLSHHRITSGCKTGANGMGTAGDLVWLSKPKLYLIKMSDSVVQFLQLVLSGYVDDNAQRPLTFGHIRGWFPETLEEVLDVTTGKWASLEFCCSLDTLICKRLWRQILSSVPGFFVCPLVLASKWPTVCRRKHLQGRWL